MSVPTVEKGHASRRVPAGWWQAPEDSEETPELFWPLSVEVYDRMRRQDAQVMSVLRAVTLPIRRTQWRVDGEGCKARVVQLVADDLGLPIAGKESKPGRRTRDRFSWAEHLRLALLMLPFGHSFFEQVYRIDEVTGQARLRKLGWRPPRTISGIDVAADGGLEAIRQDVLVGTSAGVRIPVENLVAYVNDREGGNWLGQSLLRPAYKFWLLKDRALRTQSITLDRNGLGVPIYEQGPDPDGLRGADLTAWRQKDLAAGLDMAQRFRGGESSGAAVANGAHLLLKGVDGKLPDADPVIRYYDEQIARSALGHFLNLGTETGSWALGSTFADFFTLSLQTIAMQIADVATQHVVEDLVDLNFGPDEPAPQITFDEIGSRSPATADALKLLVDAGVITPDDALQHSVRTQFGLPAAVPVEGPPAPRFQEVGLPALVEAGVISPDEARQLLGVTGPAPEPEPEPETAEPAQEQRVAADTEGEPE